MSSIDKVTVDSTTYNISSEYFRDIVPKTYGIFNNAGNIANSASFSGYSSPINVLGVINNIGGVGTYKVFRFSTTTNIAINFTLITSLTGSQIGEVYTIIIEVGSVSGIFPTLTLRDGYMSAGSITINTPIVVQFSKIQTGNRQFMFTNIYPVAL